MYCASNSTLSFFSSCSTDDKVKHIYKTRDDVSGSEHNTVLLHTFRISLKNANDTCTSVPVTWPQITHCSYGRNDKRVWHTSDDVIVVVVVDVTIECTNSHTTLGRMTIIAALTLLFYCYDDDDNEQQTAAMRTRKHNRSKKRTFSQVQHGATHKVMLVFGESDERDAQSLWQK